MCFAHESSSISLFQLSFCLGGREREGEREGRSGCCCCCCCCCFLAGCLAGSQITPPNPPTACYPAMFPSWGLLLTSTGWDPTCRSTGSEAILHLRATSSDSVVGSTHFCSVPLTACCCWSRDSESVRSYGGCRDIGCTSVAWTCAAPLISPLPRQPISSVRRTSQPTSKEVGAVVEMGSNLAPNWAPIDLRLAG